VPINALLKLLSKSRLKFISKRAKGLSIIIIYTFLILFVSLLAVVIVPTLISSLFDIARSIPAYQVTVLDFMNNLPEDFPLRDYINSEAVMDFFSNLTSDVLNPGRLAQISRSAMSLASGVLNIVISLASSLYIMLYGEQIADYFKRLSSALFKKDKKTRDRVQKYFSQVNNVLLTFIASKGFDSLINIVVVTGILLVFNIPYAFLLGFIAGILNFIPYLGSMIAVILICLITLLTDGFGKVLQMILPLLVFQQLDGNLIEPKIMGNTLKINPLLIIFSVVVGGAYFGVAGMFLAVPIVTVVKQLLGEYISNTGDTGDIDQGAAGSGSQTDEYEDTDENDENDENDEIGESQ
jgi:predicted PurR-regulated permease PerM